MFKLTPSAGGWTYTLLHEFTYDDGANPYAEVAIGANGRIYGTTSAGGTHFCGGAGCGVVFEITP